MANLAAEPAPRSCVIIGASHAGTTLALQLRREGWQGPIKLLSADPELPYHRPPLTKDYLSGSKELDAVRLRPAKVFADNDVELLLGTRVLSIDRDRQQLQLADGDVLGYDTLALCTGAEVCRLPIGGDQESLFYVRTAADATALRQQLKSGSRAVVIGGGYIGLEAAAVLSGAGMEVTVVEAAGRVLSRVTSPALSDYMHDLHAAHGVQIKTDCRLGAIKREQGVSAVTLADGEVLEAELVVVGIGVRPDTVLAEAAGLDCDNGIVVDKHCRSSDPHIFAAGDCSNFHSPLYDRSLRLESVQNATDQARVAAANINGREVNYDAVPWFWSDQYDIKLQTAGLSDGYDSVVQRGDMAVAGGGFVLFYLREGRLIAADCVNRPREFMVSKQLILARATPDPAQLADEAVELRDLLC